MKRRILLVDDDRSVLLTLKAVLEMNGFEVHTAESSASAFDQLERGPYDLVLTDSHMETENSGYDVIRAARNQSYKPVTAILTAFTTAQPELDSVANAVLLKPVGAGELLRRVETLLRSCPRSE
jgi:DNA-binding response OmpR family regulator